MDAQKKKPLGQLKVSHIKAQEEIPENPIINTIREYLDTVLSKDNLHYGSIKKQLELVFNDPNNLHFQFISEKSSIWRDSPGRNPYPEPVIILGKYYSRDRDINRTCYLGITINGQREFLPEINGDFLTSAVSPTPET